MSITALAEMIWLIKKIKHEETRKESEDYLEIVTLQASMPELAPILEGYFGPPLKPAGKNANKEVDRHVEAFGGIQKDQTLYFKQYEKASHIAMIWPWQDGKRATVKIVHGDAH